jgi:hypothetical protein
MSTCTPAQAARPEHARCEDDGGVLRLVSASRQTGGHRSLRTRCAGRARGWSVTVVDDCGVRGRVP